MHTHFFHFFTNFFVLESEILDKKLIFSTLLLSCWIFFFKQLERVRGSNLAHITDTKRSSFIYFVVVVVVVAIIVTNTIILL